MENEDNNQAPASYQRDSPSAHPGPEDATNSNGRDSEVIGSAALRPVFLGNLYPDYSADKIKELFSRPIPPPGCSEGQYNPIPVDRVDVKRGYCFVFLKDAASQQDKDQVERFVADINGM